jgi:hypothetical protein
MLDQGVPGEPGQPTRLTWTLPIGTAQFKGVLPDDVAIWIREARFSLPGIKPNSRGNVLTSVATSGSYQNGFGPRQSHSFVTKALQGDYGFKASNSAVYIPWQINTDIYTTPTPFTHRTMTFDGDRGDPSAVERANDVSTMNPSLLDFPNVGDHLRADPGDLQPCPSPSPKR